VRNYPTRAGPVALVLGTRRLALLNHPIRLLRWNHGLRPVLTARGSSRARRRRICRRGWSGSNQPYRTSPIPSRKRHKHMEASSLVRCSAVAIGRTTDVEPRVRLEGPVGTDQRALLKRMSSKPAARAQSRAPIKSE
jgi:hypothetical protein